MIRTVFNFIAFQLGWFSCVLGAANGLPWLGALVALVVVLLHFGLASRPSRELRLVLVAMLMGLFFDSLLVISGWLSYPNGMLLPGTAPYWIIAMWALFATTLNASMGWLKGRYTVAAALGAVFGPLSYVAGWRLGGLEFNDFGAAMIGLGVVWAVAMPLLIGFAERFNGLEAERHEPTGDVLAVKS